MTFPALGGVPVILIAAAIVIPVHAAESTNGVGTPDAATIDAIIHKMEASGKLDAAVDRAIDRYVKRKEVARQAEETKKLTELAQHARPIDPKQDHIRGVPTAEVSLIEYADFECPFCKRFHATPEALVERYGGRVNWVLRDFPLAFHDPAAHQEAFAAECVARLAGNYAYWKYADALYANTKSNGSGLPADHSVDKLAAGVGIKASALEKCMSSPETASRVERDLSDGTAAGVSGTPTTIVRNNKTGASQALVGALPETALVQAIDRALGGGK